MASRSNRLAKIEPQATRYVSVGDVHAEIDDIVRRNPCLPSHRPPEGLTQDQRLAWIDLLLTSHESGRCEMRDSQKGKL